MSCRPRKDFISIWNMKGDKEQHMAQTRADMYAILDLDPLCDRIDYLTFKSRDLASVSQPSCTPLFGQFVPRSPVRKQLLALLGDRFFAQSAALRATRAIASRSRDDRHTDEDGSAREVLCGSASRKLSLSQLDVSDSPLSCSCSNSVLSSTDTVRAPLCGTTTEEELCTPGAAEEES